MSNDLALYFSKQLLWYALLIASPVVLTALLTGLIVSVLQVVTQIQDSTLNLVPKILSVTLILMFCGDWMLHHLIEFAQTILTSIPKAVKP